MTKEELLNLGIQKAGEFCAANDIPRPAVRRMLLKDWRVQFCAYYRPGEGITICIEKCARPAAGEKDIRNWNWPGAVIDREPCGVVCHELGHHLDHCAGRRKGRYYSEYSEEVMKESGEPPITSYHPNPAEWFAEMVRLYITNHALLKLVRPKTWELFRKRWIPTSGDDWKEVLGSNVPDRILRSTLNKIKKAPICLPTSTELGFTASATKLMGKSTSGARRPPSKEDGTST